MRLLWLVLLGTLALLGASSLRTSHAQPVQATSANSKVCRQDVECAKLLEAGKEHSRAGRLDEAQRAYEQAYKRRPDPLLLFNLGRIHHRANRPAQAIPYYQRYLDAGADGNEDQRQKTQKLLEQATQEATPATAPPTPPIGPQTSTEKKSATPIYRKWWLWVAVGAAASAVAIGVGVGVASRPPDLSDATHVYPFGG